MIGSILVSAGSFDLIMIFLVNLEWVRSDVFKELRYDSIANTLLPEANVYFVSRQINAFD